MFSKAVFNRYVERVCADIERSAATAEAMGGRLERNIDSIYLGGGTPSLLDIAQLRRLFVTISQNFVVASEAEITVECAPGTLKPETIEMLRALGMNRVSLGVQSFVDREAASVGRLHTRQTVLDDVANLRAAGIENINVDLIAGLPHQTAESWQLSLDEVIASRVPHVSVYMLEVDEDSRLGRELIAGGTKYHAHFVPDENLTADMYETACERLGTAGIRQYEISNFAAEGSKAQHNLKYWTRQPYLGFGVDAHSMLLNTNEKCAAVRFSMPDSLEQYFAGGEVRRVEVDRRSGIEEAFFLGLRLNCGVDMTDVEKEFGSEAVGSFAAAICESVESGLLGKSGSVIRLTARGRLLSNEVFERFVSAAV